MYKKYEILKNSKILLESKSKILKQIIYFTYILKNTYTVNNLLICINPFILMVPICKMYYRTASKTKPHTGYNYT